MKRPNSPRMARATVLAAIVGSNANYALIAMRLRRSVAWVKKTIQADPILYAAFKDEENTLLEYAEGVLMGHLAKGSLSAAMFVLNQKGRERGWGSTVTLRTENDTPLGIVIMPAPARKDEDGDGTEEQQAGEET